MGWIKLAECNKPNNETLVFGGYDQFTDGWAVGSDGCIIRWDGTSWNNVTSPTTAWLNSVDMISSTDGWIVGADGNIYHWQEEEAPFIPTDYLLIIVGGAVAVAVVAVLFFLRKRNLKPKSL